MRWRSHGIWRRRSIWPRRNAKIYVIGIGASVLRTLPFRYRPADGDALKDASRLTAKTITDRLQSVRHCLISWIDSGGSDMLWARREPLQNRVLLQSYSRCSHQWFDRNVKLVAVTTLWAGTWRHLTSQLWGVGLDCGLCSEFGMTIRLPIPSTSALLVAALVILSGCASEATRLSSAQAPKSYNDNILTLIHTVHFLPGSPIPADDQATGLASFVSTTGIGSGDHVTVVVANDAPTYKRQTAVIDMLKGLQIHASQDSSFGTPPAPDTALIRVAMHFETRSRCPDLTQPAGVDIATWSDGNFGCVTTVDIALKAANPATFERLASFNSRLSTVR